MLAGGVKASPRTSVPCVAALLGLLLATACGAGSSNTSGKPTVVAAENVWGSIAGQLGGDRVQVRSIVANPDADPHDYEARPSDGRLVAGASYVIVNGAGYDPWMQRLIDANPAGGRRTLDVGKLVGVADGGNPHLWYSPPFVRQVIDRITADLKETDPGGAAYFDGQRTSYTTRGLARYDELRAMIRQRYIGTPVGATESVFAYMASDLRLDLVTPRGFMNAVSEGGDPTATDKATVDAQIAGRQIRVLVFNSQNSTPGVRALVNKAKAAGIAVTPVTETPEPGGASFQDWQSKQLQDLLTALGSR